MENVAVHPSPPSAASDTAHVYEVSTYGALCESSVWMTVRRPAQRLVTFSAGRLITGGFSYSRPIC